RPLFCSADFGPLSRPLLFPKQDIARVRPEGERMKTGLGIFLMFVTLLPAVLAQQTVNRFVPVTDSMLEKPDPGDWLMWRRTLDGWGYSPLKQIDKKN